MNDNECAICFMVKIIPVPIPACGHTFCFLCIKGYSCGKPLASCPICRGPINQNMFLHPQAENLSITLTDPENEEKPQVVTDLENNKGKIVKREKTYWLYEGRGGWWRFDPRLEKDLNNAYIAAMPVLDMCICGSLYVVDFGSMTQYRKDVPNAPKRKISQIPAGQLHTMNVKGVSGVRIR